MSACKAPTSERFELHSNVYEWNIELLQTEKKSCVKGDQHHYKKHQGRFSTKVI